MGALFYLFTITCVLTRNRPADECRFQVKYGNKDGLLHELWQDPTGLYTTVFLGIEPETGCFVAADPVLHSPTRMFISLEFKQQRMEAVRHDGWHIWERESTRDSDEPTEVLVGGRPERLLDLVRFERAAKGLDQGHRQLLAERLSEAMRAPSTGSDIPPAPRLEEPRLHQLTREFQMGTSEILDLIEQSPRLKMAVRGWVAEDHLRRELAQMPGVADCRRLNLEGKPDIQLFYRGRGPILIECKNVLRQKTAEGLARVDFQRTRASQGDPCSRYYQPSEFDVLAACLHAVTEKWEFTYRLPREMEPHKKCAGRLSNLVRIDEKWTDADHALTAAADTLP
ncbi:MAG TPA: hypothetical protein VKY65_03085 [Alphaproteobacteria bacterium]|nr:hypothetical protein [Alphaproteobacteria bacterium]